MVTAAVIIAPKANEASALAQLGGLSLLKRALLTAQKAGISLCYIHSAEADREVLARELVDTRIRCRVVWTSPPAEHELGKDAPEGESYLIFPVVTICRPALVQDLVSQAHPGKTEIITDARDTPALAIVPGVVVAHAVTALADGAPLRQTMGLAESKTVQRSAARGYFCARINPHSSLAALERELLLSLENPRDGMVDTHINRKISRLITPWLLRTPLTPNQVTVLSCVVGLLSALCFVPGGYWGPVCGAVLLQFSVVLDCCDGEIARIKYQESPLGDWLDIGCDTVVHIAVFVGIGIAVWRNGALDNALSLASILALAVVVAFVLVTLAERTEDAGRRRNGWEDTMIDKFLAALATRDFSVLIMLSALTATLPWFLWGAAIGAHLFWLVLAWLLFRAGRFRLMQASK